MRVAIASRHESEGCSRLPSATMGEARAATRGECTGKSAGAHARPPRPRGVIRHAGPLRPRHHRGLPQPHGGVPPARRAWFADRLQVHGFQDSGRVPPAGAVRPAELRAALRGGRQGSGECCGDRRVHRRGGARGGDLPQALGTSNPIARFASSSPGRAKRRTCSRRRSPACPWEIARPCGRSAHAGRAEPARPRRPRHGGAEVHADRTGSGRVPARAVRLRRGAGLASAGGAAGAAGVARTL